MLYSHLEMHRSFAKNMWDVKARQDIKLNSKVNSNYRCRSSNRAGAHY